MELIERAGFLASLHEKFADMEAGEGHCVFVSGEAGIGKTSLVKAFCQGLKARFNIYQGTCDALFTPRPLAPLYDILLQTGYDLPEDNAGLADRTVLFTRFFQELTQLKEPILIVFEDVHWADEATLDFIKFLARRITQLRCLFILTYRDDEIHSRHPLRNVLGQLNPETFTRMQLLPLSRQAVGRMAREKGYNGEDVYSISGGNPFYVTEILASYSPGVPDNIKDSVLSVYNQQEEKTRHIWDILSIFPAGFEIRYLEKIDASYAVTIEESLDSKFLVLKEGFLFFKHELYRRTIEASLSSSTRICYNKKILDNFRGIFEQNQEIEQIIHHAKNAHEYELVVQYAPLAAAKAARLGAHTEASRLYFSAIEYYQKDDTDTLIRFYELYAYECYLVNHIREAIDYTEKAMACWKQKNDKEKEGNCMRFLSRLWWFEGNRRQAERYASQAIETLEQQAPSKAKAMAYSNMSQLKSESDHTEACIFWGEKAFAMAQKVGDEETIAHSLNSMGSTQMLHQSSLPRGIELLQQSLAIALKHSYHEHVARAYTAMGSNWVTIKDYPLGRKNLEEGIRYCEERDLDSLKFYMLGWKGRLELETAHWKEANWIAEGLIKNENLLPVIKIGALVVIATIKMRRGDPDAISLLLEAKNTASVTTELQRIIPVLLALLEYEWITGKNYVDEEVFGQTMDMFREVRKISKKSRLYFWLLRARKHCLLPDEKYDEYVTTSITKDVAAAELWEKLGCPYEHALTLFEGSDDDKRAAVSIVHGLGATAVYEKMKGEMRVAGIKSIPRGIRKSTQANPAQLTERELDVLQLLNESMPNKEIASRLFISAKTVDHHISAILFKLEVNSRARAVQEAIRLEIIK